MNVGELYQQFRGEVMDIAKPYLWSDWEVYGYMDDAYRMFVRLIGGVADFTSSLTQIDVVAGEAVATLDKRILRVESARLVSVNRPLDIINKGNMTPQFQRDYGVVREAFLDNTPGALRYMVIGEERGKCRWIQVPMVDDVVALHVFRLPMEHIDRTNPDTKFEFDEVGEEHVPHFTLWMKHRAYMKADVDTFDKGKADGFKAQFTDYCTLAKAEWERYKYKPREVAYGGI